MTNSPVPIKSEAWKLAMMSHEKRCGIICDIANALLAHTDRLLAENAKDLQEADGIAPAMYDRLLLNAERIASMAAGMKKVALLPDPLGVTDSWTHDNGMTLSKTRVPLGIILVVYEARPNVSTDTVALALKTGNVSILKGSRQTKYSNACIGNIIDEVLAHHDMQSAVKFFADMSHAEAEALISSEHLDLIIPRGGEKLKHTVKTLAKAPVLGAGGGLCHAYVSESADLTMAASIIDNAKTQRPSVCNSLETVLLHASHLTRDHLQQIFAPLIAKNVKFHISAEISEIWGDMSAYTVTDDWSREFLDLEIAIKAVSNVDEAIVHINNYSTHHSDSIISADDIEIQRFVYAVDSACVYANASLRFTDGEVFGFGAEIGISTQKLHARGPIALPELTTYKYIINGNGQTR